MNGRSTSDNLVVAPGWAGQIMQNIALFYYQGTKKTQKTEFNYNVLNE